MPTVTTKAPAPLRLSVAETNNLEAVVRCSGRLLSENAVQLKDQVIALLVRYPRVVLDFTALEYMDSSGLGTVIKLSVSAKTSGRELQLINLNQRVKELLGITHVLGALTACGEYMIKTP